MENEPKKIILQPIHVQVLKFIRGFKEKKIYSPTIQEITKSTKYSYRQIYRIVSDLIQLGYLKKEKFHERSLEILIKEF